MANDYVAFAISRGTRLLPPLHLFPTDNTLLRCPSSLSLSLSVLSSHPSPFPKTRHGIREVLERTEEGEREKEEEEEADGGQITAGPQMIVSASFCRRLRRHHPEYARLNESVTKTPGETVRFY